MSWREQTRCRVSLLVCLTAALTAVIPVPLVQAAVEKPQIDTSQAQMAAVPRSAVPPAFRPDTPELPPMPADIARLYSTISSLWSGNRLLYCNPAHAIAQTIIEIRRLNAVRSAQYVRDRAEILIHTKDGGEGSVDITNLPAKQQNPHCLRD